MSVRIYLALGTGLLAFLFVCGTAVAGQQTYPSTGIGGFVPSTDEWAVSKPSDIDQHSGRDSEMSPDHWGSSASLTTQNPYQTSTTAQAWDGTIESHPWLDEEEFVDSNSNDFPANETTNNPLKSLPASANPDKNTKIPLPPSASHKDENESPPSWFDSEPFSEPFTSEDEASESDSTPPDLFSPDPPLLLEPSTRFGPPPSSGQSFDLRGSNWPTSRESADDSSPLSGNIEPNSFVPQAPDSENWPEQKQLIEQNVDRLVQPGSDQEWNQQVPENCPQCDSLNNRPKGLLDKLFSSRSLRRSRSNIWNSNNDYYEYELGGPSQAASDANQLPPAEDPVSPQRYPLPSVNAQNSAFPKNGPPTVAGQLLGPPSAAYRANARPNYRADLGHRAPNQTVRAGVPADFGQNFGYEAEHFPPMREILACGRYFASADTMLIKPHVQSNNAIALSNGVTRAFDWDYEVAPRFRVGFESQYGPGVELTYFQFDQDSNLSSFTSDGLTSGTASAWLNGPNQWTQLTTVANGETLDVNHSLRIHQIGASVFKEMKFRRARLNGILGIQYINIDQDLDAIMTDGGGAQIGRLTQQSNLSVFGPRVGLEYYRPIGHTRLEMVNNFGGSVLFGNRDQSVTNTAGNVLSVNGADDFLSIFDIGFAIQSHRRMGENRSVYWKVGYVAQAWIGAGTAVGPQDDIGFRGYAFTLGFNR